MIPRRPVPEATGTCPVRHRHVVRAAAARAVSPLRERKTVLTSAHPDPKPSPTEEEGFQRACPVRVP